MSFRNSYIASSSMASLSEIINLEPEQEPWCAGYAPSKGRRCHIRTNAHGRTSATILLDEGTKRLQAGRSIDALLEKLAPHVLCTRFHQGQASDLTRRWKRDVRRYLDSQVPSTPSPRPVRVVSRGVHLEAMEANAVKVADLEQRLFEAMQKVRRLEVAQQGVSNIATPPVRREGGSTSPFLASTRTQSTPSRISPPPNVIQVTPRTERTEPVRRSAALMTQSARVQRSRENAADITLPTRLRSSPLASPAFSSPEREDNQAEPSETNRREIEGECGICLCNLRLPQQDLDGDEEDESDHDESDSSQDNNEDGSDGVGNEEAELTEERDEVEHQEEELVWCKARCGVNFHKRCIDQWLQTKRAPTCPMCRNGWKN